jgi:hypothetical protein
MVFLLKLCYNKYINSFHSIILRFLFTAKMQSIKKQIICIDGCKDMILYIVNNEVIVGMITGC